MRWLIAAACCALLAITLHAQRGGTYKDSAGTAHTWSVNSARTLVWNGQPYLPVGIWMRMTDPIDESRFDLVQQAFLSDIILEAPLGPELLPPAVWQASLDLAEKRGLRHLVAMGYAPPSVPGYRVSPQSFRVPNITGPTTQNVRIPGADRAFYVLVDRTDASVAQSGKAFPVDGVFQIDLSPRSDGEYVLLLYPHMKSDALPDYWEGYDRYRDRLLAHLRELKLGPNFRGFVDPFGRRADWLVEETDFVPNSRLFRMELERFLRKNYPTVDQLNVSWSVSEFDVPSFEVAARLIALFSRGRGTNQLLDPETDKLFAINSQRSNYWRDVRAVVREAALRRSKRLVQSIKTGVADVPVVYTWTGWAPMLEAGDAAPDGVAMTGFGRAFEVVENSGAYALASVHDWSPAGWLLASEITADPTGKTEFGAGEAVASSLDWMKSLGAKGFFARVAINKETLAWVSAYQKSLLAETALTDYSPTTLFFPESARTPAEVIRLPNNVWWLPSPASGGRLDLGRHLNGYTIARGGGTHVYIWAKTAEREVAFRATDPKAVSVLTADGKPVEVKTRRDRVTFRVGPEPVRLIGLGDAPTPIEAEEETIDDFARVLAMAQAMKVDISDLRAQLEQGRSVAQRGAQGGYEQMRTALRQARFRLAPYVWAEAEQSRDQIFGDTPSVRDASNGQALRVNTTIDPPGSAYYARYEITVPADGQYTLYLGGTPPGSNGASPLEWIMDNTPINVVSSANAIARYGREFAWFTLGSTRLTAGRHTLTLRARANQEGNYRSTIDLILLTPRPFTPDGINPPPVE